MITHDSKRPDPSSELPFDFKHFVRFFTWLATENAWEEEYVGEGANLLWADIQECFKEVPLDLNRHFYAKYCAIVQSSGMGKSRTVDEMSKFHFVIPVNLREHDSTGMPSYSLLYFPSMLNVLNFRISPSRWSSTWLSYRECNTKWRFPSKLLIPPWVICSDSYCPEGHQKTYRREILELYEGGDEVWSPWSTPAGILSEG